MNFIYKNSCLVFLLSFVILSASEAMEKQQNDIKIGFLSCLFSQYPGLSAKKLCKFDESFITNASNTKVMYTTPCPFSAKLKLVDVLQPLQSICEYVYSIGFENGSHAREKLSLIQRHSKKSAFGFMLLGTAIPVSIYSGWLWLKTAR